MKTYRIELNGLSDLLMHNDDIQWADAMKKWQTDPENKKISVAGDDRSPAFTWLGCLYHDGCLVGVPYGNIMRCLMEGGAQVLVPKGKNGKTFKAQTQSGMLVAEELWPLTVAGKEILVQPLLDLMTETNFDAHVEAAKANGFSLLVKRATIGQKKHVRVRPRFAQWRATGTISVWDEQLTLEVLRDILKVSGANKGIGDWRPSSKTPGPFGRFSAEISKVN